MIWGTAVAAAIAVAAWQYGWPRGKQWWPAAMRALAVALLVGLVFDLPLGPSAIKKPFVALDVSASWQRGGDLAAYRTAIAHAKAVQADSISLFGDSLRAGMPPDLPTDTRTIVRPAVDHALAAGRALVVITDGEIDDPDALAALPAGSRIDVIPHTAQSDAAIEAINAPHAAIAGDTITVRPTVISGQGGAAAGTLTVTLGSKTTTVVVPDLAPYAELTPSVRLVAEGHEGVRDLHASVRSPGDAEPRNDTMTVPIDLSPAAGAVFVSTSPDEDARYALSVLREAASVPTRAFYRVAPGVWRAEGTLTPVAESNVLHALASAPLAVIHGDSSAIGSPRALTHGSLGLIVPTNPKPTLAPEEWYATDAPPSPLAAALADTPWDSLPPIEISDTSLHEDWIGLEAKRGRRGQSRAVVAGFESGHRRIAIVAASGLWRWRFRGGVAADAYSALWGSLFDWLTTEHGETKVPTPAVTRSRELLPRKPVVTSRRVEGKPPAESAPRLRSFGWVYVIIVLALCLEWVMRRRMGLR